MIRDNHLFKRYDALVGKTPPTGFEPAQDPDPVTGHWPGWLPIGEGPEDRWHREAFAAVGGSLPDGTYELIGPKIQGNPERVAAHTLIAHGQERLPDVHTTSRGSKPTSPRTISKVWCGGETRKIRTATR